MAPKTRADLGDIGWKQERCTRCHRNLIAEARWELSRLSRCCGEGWGYARRADGMMFCSADTSLDKWNSQTWRFSSLSTVSPSCKASERPVVEEKIEWTENKQILEYGFY